MMRETIVGNVHWSNRGIAKGCTELYTTGWIKGKVPQRWSVNEPLDLEGPRKRRSTPISATAFSMTKGVGQNTLRNYLISNTSTTVGEVG
jgi:hypothetical protein